MTTTNDILTNELSKQKMEELIMSKFAEIENLQDEIEALKEQVSIKRLDIQFLIKDINELQDLIKYKDE